MCSPTRAGVLTGRHSFRTGIGEAATPSNGLVLDAAEWTLPRALDGLGSGYAHASFGKWHLGGGDAGPNDFGWSHYSGSPSGGLPSYTSWTKVTDGVSGVTTTYATTANVDDALAWIDGQSSPWLTWIGFNAPHTPFHLPPADLHTQGDLSGTAADIAAQPERYYDAAIEALDTEIGRLLDTLDPDVAAETTVVFLGDNGNPTQVSSYGMGAAKGSLTAGGIRVPMMIWGAGVTGGRHSDTPVGSVDLFSTILDLAGVPDGGVTPSGAPLDSRSLVPELSGGSLGDDVVLSELFGTDTAPARQGATIRDERYQLVSYANGSIDLYDLATDPRTESPIPAGSRNAAEQAAFDALSATLEAWTASPTSLRP